MEIPKLEKLKIFSNMYGSLIAERNKTIIFIIQIFIALLIIATFSEKIIPVTKINATKNLIIFLLSSIPIMLFDYILQINDGLNALHKEIGFKQNKKSWYINLINGSNYLYALIAIVVIDFIIQLINQNILSSLLIFLIQAILIGIIVFSKRIDNS